jgi:hypothetical protein
MFTSALSVLLDVAQVILDDIFLPKGGIPDGSSKYGIKPDKQGFAIDENGNTVLGDKITLSLMTINGTIVDASKIT